MVVYFIFNLVSIRPSLVSIFRHSGYQGCIINCQIFIGTRGTIYLDGNRHFDIPFQMLGTNVLASQISKEIFAKFTLGGCADSQTNPILIALGRKMFLSSIKCYINDEIQKLISTFWQNSNNLSLSPLPHWSLIGKIAITIGKKLCNNFQLSLSRILRKRTGRWQRIV